MDKEVIKKVFDKLDSEDSYSAKKIFKDEIKKDLDETINKYKESGEIYKNFDKKEEN